MRLLGLLGFLLAATLAFGGSDQAATPQTNWLVTRSGTNGYMFVPMRDSQQFPGLPLSVRQRARSFNPDDNVCLMLRTYIMVRESPDSDVTHRDGHFVCQPAWRFQVRTADQKTQDR